MLMCRMNDMSNESPTYELSSGTRMTYLDYDPSYKHLSESESGKKQNLKFKNVITLKLIGSGGKNLIFVINLSNSVGLQKFLPSASLLRKFSSSLNPGYKPPRIIQS